VSRGHSIFNKGFCVMTKIAVCGLGYVGLPVAVALARHFDVTGDRSEVVASHGNGQSDNRSRKAKTIDVQR
jgi:UDP-N-acetyl-D-mannosaminuronate dehydrogenase